MCPTLRLPERFDLVLIIDALTTLADPMAALISSNEHTAGAVLVQTALPGVSEMLASASQCSVTGSDICCKLLYTVHCTSTVYTRVVQTFPSKEPNFWLRLSHRSQI